MRSSRMLCIAERLFCDAFECKKERDSKQAGSVLPRSTGRVESGCCGWRNSRAAVVFWVAHSLGTRNCSTIARWQNKWTATKQATRNACMWRRTSATASCSNGRTRSAIIEAPSVGTMRSYGRDGQERLRAVDGGQSWRPEHVRNGGVCVSVMRC